MPYVLLIYLFIRLFIYMAGKEKNELGLSAPESNSNNYLADDCLQVPIKEIQHYVNGVLIQGNHHFFYLNELSLENTTTITRQRIHHAYHRYLAHHERHHRRSAPDEVMEGKAAELYLLDRWDYIHWKN